MKYIEVYVVKVNHPETEQTARGSRGSLTAEGHRHSLCEKKWG